MIVFLPDSVRYLSAKEKKDFQKALIWIYSTFLLFGVSSTMVGFYFVDMIYVIGGIVSFIFGILTYLYCKNVVLSHDHHHHLREHNRHH